MHTKPDLFFHICSAQILDNFDKKIETLILTLLAQMVIILPHAFISIVISA